MRFSRHLHKAAFSFFFHRWSRLPYRRPSSPKRAPSMERRACTRQRACTLVTCRALRAYTHVHCVGWPLLRERLARRLYGRRISRPPPQTVLRLISTKKNACLTWLATDAYDSASGRQLQPGCVSMRGSWETEWEYPGNGALRFDRRGSRSISATS